MREQEKRAEQILKILQKYIEKDFSHSIPLSDKGDYLDAISVGLNTMAEELQAYVEESRRAERQIKQMNADLIGRTAQLEVLNKELEAFSYSVSHDLRAPLRHIDGFLQLLDAENGSQLDEEGRRYVRIVLDAAKNMANLIDDLLVFSHMGRIEMMKSTINNEKLVRSSIEDLRREIGGRKIHWSIDGLPSIEADPSMMKLVWMNLLSNAVKYTAPRQEASIHVGFRKINEEMVFFVKDNGVGFDMDYVDKLFGVFQRLHRSEEFEGTGIGLANVRRIVDRHGGKTWAEGSSDKGATFYFSIPTVRETT